VDLKEIYLTSLQLCAPEILVQAHIRPTMPRNVVAIGKCAGALLDGVAAIHPVESAFVAIPEGYRLPQSPAEVHVGGHPFMTPASFAAGRALLTYVDRHDDLLFLVSGGGSACVEVPMAPATESEVAARNAELVSGGLPIAAINAERRRLSAIKGGRLGARVRGTAVTLVYSDVSTDAWGDVASGPTRPDLLIADNSTLVQTAARLCGENAIVLEEQLECDVEEAARLLAERAADLRPGQFLVAGGEPTVVVRGSGKGGRCTELAVRFAARCPFRALFGSSDGVDGNSGVAAIHLPARSIPGNRDGFQAGFPPAFQAALDNSDSLSVAMQVGEPIIIASAGNNLRDLYLVARD
jgi:glycerate 2-kinase